MSDFNYKQRPWSRDISQEEWERIFPGTHYSGKAPAEKPVCMCACDGSVKCPIHGDTNGR